MPLLVLNLVPTAIVFDEYLAFLIDNHRCTLLTARVFGWYSFFIIHDSQFQRILGKVTSQKNI